MVIESCSSSRQQTIQSFVSILNDALAQQRKEFVLRIEMYGGVVEKEVSNNPSLRDVKDNEHQKWLATMCYYGPKNILFFKLHSCYCYGNKLLTIKDSYLIQ